MSNMPGSLFSPGSIGCGKWKCGICISEEGEKGVDFMAMKKNSTELNAKKLFNAVSVLCDKKIMDLTIDIVAVYKQPLETFPLETFPLNKFNACFHAFVLLFVELYKVRIEKYDCGLQLIISKTKEQKDLQSIKNEKQTTTVLEVADHGKMTLNQLLTFIAKKEFAHEGYDFMKGVHCKKFAKDIFDEVAQKETFFWKEDEVKARGGVATGAAATGATFVGLVAGGPVGGAAAAIATAAIGTAVVRLTADDAAKEDKLKKPARN